ncbi:MAG TPA: two-component regulator propeller domain-containing protein [Thermoanaerobaculaceae bacterium]|nr:two-component regulator propeller domain-containing protein [Thermoanaerobaculaceae bacterium]HRS14976.1 two-component regulator propeller domain-containing protein [Thermoanaerobaculaceae bacterium]
MPDRRLSCPTAFRILARAALFCALARGAAALDPARTIDQYVRDVWSTEQGLPQSSVEVIFQDRDGFMWFGTQEGLARFDGVSFRVLDRAVVPELGENVIASLAEDDAGTLWIGTTLGLVALQDGVPAAFGASEGLPGRGVRAILPAGAGEVWLGTRGGGLGILSSGRVRVVSVAQGLAHDGVWSLARTPDGEVWVATSGGVSRVHDGRTANYGREHGLPGLQVRAILARRDGSVWAGTDRGVARFDGARFVTEVEAAGLGGAAVWSLLEDRDGSLWIGTYGAGLFRLAAGRLDRCTEHDGLPGNLVRSLFEDREGSLWVGFSARGVARLKDTSFTTVLARHGLPHEYVTAVMEDRDGRLLVGTFGGGLARLENGRWVRVDSGRTLPSHDVWSLAQGRDGSLWVGTLGNGMAHLQVGRVAMWTSRNGLSSDGVRAIVEDRAGDVWVATRRGLSRIRGGSVDVFGAADGLPADGFYCLHEDAHGRLWVGTSGGGVCRMDGGRPVTFPESGDLARQTVYDILEDADRTLWFGTSGAGIWRLRGGRWSAVTTREGLFDNTAFRLLDDGLGGMWASCNKGVFRVERRQLEEVMEGRASRVECEVFGAGDGLASAEANGGSQPSGWRGHDGRLYFPTVRGLAIVDPARLVRNTVAPRVRVEAVTAGGETFDARAPLRLGPGSNDLEIRYTALSFRAPARVGFRYRLAGFDRDWVEAGPRRVAYYTNVPPGTYRFEVVAANEDGVWSPEPAALPLTLTPPFWSTWWFRGAGAVLLAGLVLGLYRLRVRHLERDRRTLERLVAERTAELAALNAQKNEFLGMAAHDLRSPLGVISAWTGIVMRSLESGRFGPERAARELGRVMAVADHLNRVVGDLLDVSSIESGTLCVEPCPTSLTALLDEVVQLYSTLAAEKGTALVLRPGTGEAMALADRDRIIEVLSNLVSNAIKFTPPGGRVSVWWETAPGEIVTHVEDTGPGLSEADQQALFRRFGRLSARPTAGEPSTGLGLAIVKKIVEAHRGRVWAANAEGGGARFSFALPAAPPSPDG